MSPIDCGRLFAFILYIHGHTFSDLSSFKQLHFWGILSIDLGRGLQRRGCSLEILKRAPKSYQDPFVWTLKLFSLLTGSNSAKAPTVDVLRLNSLEHIETAFLTPKRHHGTPLPRPFLWESPRELNEWLGYTCWLQRISILSEGRKVEEYFNVFLAELLGKVGKSIVVVAMRFVFIWVRDEWAYPEIIYIGRWHIEWFASWVSNKFAYSEP